MVGGLERVAAKYGERVLKTPGNTISFGMTLGGGGRREEEEEEEEGESRGAISPPAQKKGEEEEEEEGEARSFSYLGSMLFTRGVSGTRVVVPSSSSSSRREKKVAGVGFVGWGSHCDSYPPGPYLTAACAVGGRKEEVEEFVRRLDKALGEWRRKGGGGGVVVE